MRWEGIASQCGHCRSYRVELLTAQRNLPCTIDHRLASVTDKQNGISGKKTGLTYQLNYPADNLFIYLSVRMASISNIVHDLLTVLFVSGTWKLAVVNKNNTETTTDTSFNKHVFTATLYNLNPVKGLCTLFALAICSEGLHT